MNVPRGGALDETLAPAWLPMQDAASGAAARPLIRCACGTLVSIRWHRVYADGRVTASFLHADLLNSAGELLHVGCGFHEMLVLDGYAADPLYAGREFSPGD